MSVYTQLSAAEISNLLEEFELGQYQSHKGISAGVENTNYFVETDQYSLVLTLFEKHSIEDLPFYLQLGEFLYQRNCKVPQPFRCKNGNFLKIVKHKPAVFIERLRGKHVQPKQKYAREIAVAMAEIHTAMPDFQLSHSHSHNRQWINNTAIQVADQFHEEDKALLKSAVDIIRHIPDDLPEGIIHADLFHDNALFEDNKITGIIDWYFAGHDSFALDIAIAMNDWCLDNDGLIDLAACEEFIDAYNQKRQLSEAELIALPLLQIQSATRFWLSRWLAKQEYQHSSDDITVKDPNQMQRLTHQLIDYTSSQQSF